MTTSALAETVPTSWPNTINTSINRNEIITAQV
jgi:hypothetical protein